MKVIVGCEFSSVVREAFATLGHDAWSCDLLPSAVPGKHIIGDVRNVLRKGWNLAIFHPPCTYLCNSGVRWLRERPERWPMMIDAACFVRELLDAPIDFIGLENPIMHGWATKIVGRKHDQVVQPWQFGHGETKATCLWLKNLPPLQPTNIVAGREHRIWKMPRTDDRGLKRSITYQGIARAMAEQWTKAVERRISA